MSNPPASGILFIVSAPSGAGKTSLLEALLRADEQLTVSISHTTRPRRPKEADGVNYHFVGREEFERMIVAGEFLEHAEVFGNCYGTSLAGVEAALAGGADVVLEIDWQGAGLVRQARQDAVSIFILPPSQQALRERLQHRAQDDAQVIEARLAEARGEIRHYEEFDYLVINDHFHTALTELAAIVRAERCRRPYRSAHYRQLLDALLVQ